MATAESQSLDIYPGQDLAAVVNGDPATTATTFYVHGQNGDPYTYNVSATLLLNTGDKLIGDAGTFLERGPAFDPQPIVNIVGDASVSNVIRAEGTVHLEWVKVVGGTGTVFEWLTGSRHWVRGIHGKGVRHQQPLRGARHGQRCGGASRTPGERSTA
jgi:hypothetical protein